MLKPVFVAVLSFFLPFAGSFNLFNGSVKSTPKANTGTLEKMIISNGTVAMDLDLNRLNGARLRTEASKSGELRFDVKQNSFFTVMVFNDELRGPLPSSMALIPQNSVDLPAKMQASYRQLVVERAPWGEHFELVVRDAKTGFNFFNIEGHQFSYDADKDVFSIRNGRLLLSNDFAAQLGRSSEAGSIFGRISVTAKMRPIEVTQIVDGEVDSDVMPALNSPEDGSVPGPDVIVGDVYGLAQFGSNGTQVGLAVGTNSCNFF